MAAKQKISVSLPAVLLAEIDRDHAGPALPSRSAVIEAALRSWLREQREAGIEAYYRALAADERGEDLDWAELGMEAFQATARREERLRPVASAVGSRGRKRRGPRS